ncbi:SAM-dependent methyltransferase [Prauserella sediminis]|uniref:SAM-dependent methyltransferase n=1 Tax=Prauserella sediminis TaxID=577680 RepID=A0A839XS50_9PSEU|nr:methyltransferase domain-containing protein [Prauserella sediminis]MBB3666010.1 SAM-dependent methyltransferase [Prauserella sediminis]
MSTPGATAADTDNATDTATDAHTATAVVDRAYRLILGRAPDADGLAYYTERLRCGELSKPQLCAALASSDEFAGRLSPEQAAPEAGAARAAAARDPEFVDAAELLRTTTVEDLAATAEEYFSSLDDAELLLTKPLKEPGEAADLLVTFGQVLRGLQPAAGMTVLDFGAGTCWTSRLLTQLGCHVIAADVSPSALALGRELYARQPVLGDRPEPEFLTFDGHRIDLPDGSVDRILSYDALHHVPNPDQVLAEFARVLRPGGLAAFAEPGPEHSLQPQSQYEMRHFGVLENDVVIEQVWDRARRIGFADLRLCLLDSAPQWVDLPTFQDVLAAHADGSVFPEPTRAAIGDRRMFVLRRDGVETPDSRAADGLRAELTFSDLEVTASTSGVGGTTVRGTCLLRNSGTRTWLPSDAAHGPVFLGARLRTADGMLSDRLADSGGRTPLPGRGVAPGEEVTVAVRLDVPGQLGDATGAAPVAVEFDLVSEFVCWFSINGSAPVTVPLP